MAEKEKKVTTMVLDVDLQCPKCYKKVKRILCKFPQIQDQVYDEKANKVIIKVVCCSPEKIRDKLCCKGRGCIKSIEIPKPPPEKPPPAPAKPQPQPEPAKPQPQPEPAKPQPQPEPAKKPPPEPAKPAEPVRLPPQPEPAKKPPPEPAKPPTPVPVCYLPPPCWPPPCRPPPCRPPPCRPPEGFCCTECYCGVPGGPCFRGEPIQYDGYYGRPVYDSWGGGGWCRSPCYVSRCDFFSEENPQGCSIM